MDPEEFAYPSIVTAPNRRLKRTAGGDPPPHHFSTLKGAGKAGPEPTSRQTSLPHRPVHEWRRLLEAIAKSIAV
jgi:hypothetical protein